MTPERDGVADEAAEMAQDVTAYREANAADDGARITLEELRRSIAT